MSKRQTDNTRLHEKIKLRKDSINLIDKSEVLILECFAGDGVIWEEVKKTVNKSIKILRIDLKPDKKGVYLKGDNLKFLKNMSLDKFDIIDLDAYGSPFEQLEVLFQKKYKGIVHCTFIQSMMGNLNKKMLNVLGFTDVMIKKCPSLFNSNGLDKMLNYLHRMNVSKIVGYFIDRKNYFYFNAK